MGIVLEFLGPCMADCRMVFCIFHARFGCSWGVRGRLSRSFPTGFGGPGGSGLYFNTYSLKTYLFDSFQQAALSFCRLLLFLVVFLGFPVGCPTPLGTSLGSAFLRWCFCRQKPLCTVGELTFFTLVVGYPGLLACNFRFDSSQWAGGRNPG